MRNLSKWFSNSDVNSLRQDWLTPFETQFNRMMNEFFDDSFFDSARTAKVGYPKMDIGVEGEHWVISVAVPGVSKEDLQVELSDDRVLSVSGRMSGDYQSPAGSKYFIKELRRSEFRREVQLPKEVLGDPEASMRNGILVLRWALPKKERGDPGKRVIDIG